ncbi:hypothetical protein [Tardiphaga robiniae]|uniref:hypothetical protein n=1 Tax=Tardiphaga robiniae TaxID=943830 RepID=UPI001585D47B|nr:hypothetical protein [Tardiphaga robiniae]NUU44497.1 hypothetical protein [Tardiphaga robiniae]
MIAVIVYAVRTTAPPNSPASFTPAPAPPPALPAVRTVPDGPSIPHAFTVLPVGYDKGPAEKLAAADAMIARWEKWKAKPLPEVIPFADYRNARMNLTTIKETDPEYQAALDRAAKLDGFGVALANEEIKVAEKIRAAERARAEQAVINDVPGRKAFAKTLEEQFLRKSMDARVSTEGDKGTVLRVKYIGFTRPSVFQLQENGSFLPGLIENAREKGFRKLILHNGYDLSWTWELKKTSG